MALTPTQEAQVLQLVAEQAALLSLADNEATIISKLGATKVNLSSLGSAVAFNDADIMLIRQGTTDLSIAGSVVKAAVGVPDATDTVKGKASLAIAANYPSVSDSEAATPLYVSSAVAAAVPDASETVKGKVELATSGETITGTSNTLAVHPAGLASVILLKGKKPGEIFDHAGTSAPAGALICPTSQTNISRTTYAELFAAIGTIWGVGDGSTTFGMPWFPADYVASQASGNVGTQTVGENLSHLHTMVFQTNQADHGITGNIGDNGTYSETRTSGSMSASGGPANLAASVRVLKCVQYL